MSGYDFPLPDGMICKDMRVWWLIDVANAILQGHNVIPEVRETLKDFPFAIEFLEHMEKKRDEGLKRFHASPAPQATVEDFAREMLGWDWACERGHTARTTVSMDGGLIRYRTNVATMKRHYYIEWRWLGDQWRVLGMKWRVFRDKKILGLRNPYLKTIP